MSNEHNVRVVIADDEGHIRVLVKMLLQQISFSVVGEAENGLEVLDLVKDRHPDLILLDVNMPQLRGVEALREIKASDAGVCIIMLTSVADMDTVQQCLEAGASNFIRKDTPIEDMKAMILETWQAHAEGAD